MKEMNKKKKKKKKDATTPATISNQRLAYMYDCGKENPVNVLERV